MYVRIGNQPQPTLQIEKIKAMRAFSKLYGNGCECEHTTVSNMN